MAWMQRIRCWATKHVWWEHWRFEKIDHCIKCGVEKPHNSAGCPCTICQFPGGLEGYKEHFTRLSAPKVKV